MAKKVIEFVARHGRDQGKFVTTVPGADRLSVDVCL